MLLSISPIDGRYSRHTLELQAYFSEYALIKNRVRVEINWLIFLSQCPGITELAPFNEQEIKFLQAIVEDFSNDDAYRVKEIERETQHDVKAVEYFIKETILKQDFSLALKDALEFIHFACTSEDINNISYALMLNEATHDVLAPNLEQIIAVLAKQAQENATLGMLSLTHGQTATPTTLGKEMRNFQERLERQYQQLINNKVTAKINGAVGNFNAHLVAYPQVDWISLSTNFIQSLGLEVNLYTTQIEPHDTIAELFHAFVRSNQILLDIAQDMWGYISRGYFVQENKKGEIGSSTMPHKVNPIYFENAEGNLGVANALLDHLAKKLAVSRFQRDLTDSTALRNVGSAVAYCLIAYKSLQEGFSRVRANAVRIDEDLADKWELLAEPIQTVMRKYAIENAYERLKDLSRGKKVTQEAIINLVKGLEIPEAEKASLYSLTPSNYIGLAVELTKKK